MTVNMKMDKDDGTGTDGQRWTPALFSPFALVSAKKKKRRARKKKARSRAFSSDPQWKFGFRAQSCSAGGKARVLSKNSSVCLRNGGEEIERERHGRDVGEETER